MTPERAEVLEAVASSVPVAPRPLLVAVDGPDGVGKTWFADELAELLLAQGRTVVRAGVDDFHHPRAHRHGSGRSPETVWSRSYDYRALRRELLDPWRRGAGSAYRIRWHDLDTDELVDVAPSIVPEDGVLVLDGVFTQRAELRRMWDLVVWLDAPPEVTVPRMAGRDGGSTDPCHPEQARYVGAQELYRENCSPAEQADFVVDLRDLDRPVLESVAEPDPCPTCGRN